MGTQAFVATSVMLLAYVAYVLARNAQNARES